MLNNARRGVWVVLICLLLGKSNALCAFSETELEALQDIYVTTSGQNWVWPPDTAGIPWNFTGNDVNPCLANWQGVNCTYAGDSCYVNALTLRSHNMVGPLPSSIEQLSSLTILDLSGNFLSNTIPSAVGNLVELRLVRLELNRLSGTIPASLGYLSELYEVDMGFNSLSGTLPDSFSRLSALKGLDYGINSITGTLPTWFGTLTQLQYIDGEKNLLTGTIPEEIGQLTVLRAIQLYNNYLTGPLPDIFATLAELTSVQLEFNGLSGSLPPSLVQAQSLTYMYLFHNDITGTLPGMLGTMPLLYDLQLYNNLLSGPLPAGLANAPKLANIDLHRNHLSGALSGALQLPLSLLDIDLGENWLTGTLPTSLSRLIHLNELQLQDNQLTGSLDGVFNASLLSSLTIIQVSGNELTGSLPAALFQLPNLQVFGAVGNCFEGPLPVTSMCASTTLRVLALDGLRSASTCQRKLFPGISSSHVITRPFSGGVAACLLQIPNLITLHLSGNGLTGTVPNICSTPTALPPSLIDLSLSHNALTGTIPKCIQERHWLNLDLSYNRLTGTLDPAFAANSSIIDAKRVITSTTLTIDNNRLSGRIPGGVNGYENLTMLTSNLFSCALDKSDLPTADKDRLNYQCGSDYLNLPYYVWLALAVVLVTVVSTAWWGEKGAVSNTNCVPATWRQSLQSAVTWIQVGFTATEDTRSNSDCPGVHAAYHAVLHDFNKVAAIAALCAVFTVLVLLPLYVGLSSQYSTVTHKYAWIVSAAYLSGVPPGVTVLVVLLVLMLTFLFTWRHACAHAGPVRGLHSERSTSGPSCADQQLSDKQPTSGTPVVRTADERVAATTLSFATRTAVYVTYVAVNFAVVAGVNTAYVYVALNQRGAAFIAAQILLSLFKLLWNKFGGVYLVRYVTSRMTVYDDTAFGRGFEQLKVFVALCNNIAIPCLVVAITSPDCFYHAFTAAPEVTSSYEYKQCYTYEPVSHGCTSFVMKTGTTGYSPPFAYSYQCSASFVTYYAPAFLYLCLTATFLSPLAQGLMYVLHRRAATAPGSLWYRLLNILLPPSLKPLPSQDSSNSTDAPANLVTPAHNPFQPYFDAAVLQVNLVTYLALILTFGAVFPPLSAALVLTVAAVLCSTRLKIGRLLTLSVDNR
jgi:hypothetical protein